MLPISVKLPTGKCLIIKQEKEDEIELKRQIEDICGVPIEIQDLINVPNNSNCSSKSEGVNKPTSYFQMKVDFCWEKVVTSALKGDLFAPSRVSLPWRGVTKRQEVFIASFIAAANGHTKLLRDILSRNFYCFVDNFKTKITKRTILHAAVISRNIEGISIMTKYSTIFSKMLTSKDYRNCTPIDIVEKYDAPEIKKIFFPDPEIESLKTSSFRNKRIEEIGNTENATYGANEFRIKEGLRDNMHQVLFQDLPNEQEDAKQDNINTRKKSLRKINVVLSSFDLDDSESGSDSGGERKKTDISCHYIKSDTSPLLQRAQESGSREKTSESIPSKRPSSKHTVLPDINNKNPTAYWRQKSVPVRRLEGIARERSGSLPLDKLDVSRSPMLRRCQDEKFGLSPNSGHDRSSRPWKDWELAFQSINQTIETPDDRDKRKLSFHQWIVTKSVPSTPEPVRKSRDKDLKAPVEGQKKGKSFQEWLGDKEKAEKEQKEAQEKAAQMLKVEEEETQTRRRKTSLVRVNKWLEEKDQLALEGALRALRVAEVKRKVSKEENIYTCPRGKRKVSVCNNEPIHKEQ